MASSSTNMLKLYEGIADREVASCLDGARHLVGVNVTTAQVKIDELYDVVTRTTGRPGKCERMDSSLSLEVVQCRQFDPVSGPFSMKERRDETQSIYTIASNTNLVPIRSRHACLKRRRHVPNLVMIFLIFLTVSLLIVTVVLAISYFMHRQAKLCETENCVRIAASFKESMDTSIDPCDDFYKYACGKWSNEHPMPDNSLSNSWFEEHRERMLRKIRELLRDNITDNNAPWSVKQAKILYSSCMDVHAVNELGLTPLFEILEELNLPPVPPAFTKKTSGYIDQMARVKKVLGRDVFFSFDVLPDPRNTSTNVMMLHTPVTSSPLPNDNELEKRLHSVRSRFRKLEEDESSSKLKEAEVTYMTDIIKQVVNNGTLDSCTLKDNSSFTDEKELKEVVESLYELTSIFYYLSRFESNGSIWDEELADITCMSVDDLQKLTDEYVTEVNSSLTPKPLWRPFIETIYKDIESLDLSGRDKILIGDLEYLKDVALALSTFEEEELETYIWWVVVDIVVPHVSDSLRKIWLDHVNKVTYVELGESKSLRCASTVNELMGMAVSWLFVDPSFHEDKGKKVFEMLSDIKEAFASLVSHTDWMDKQTKTATLEKNRKMESQIGFPKWLFDEDVLNYYYEGIDLTEAEYLNNMIQIVRLMSLSKLECIHRVNYDNALNWATDPTDVNAYHTYEFNHITIPAGILQFPFYELGIEALNYGALGTVLGHELTHGFDNNGRHFDSNGNVRQWWTNETIFEYTEKTECFIKHYSSYYEKENADSLTASLFEQVDDYIDGERTLGENIADNGGLREAVVAYERWKSRHGQELLLPGFTHLSHEQLVFLSFAHLWCEAYTPISLKWILEDTHCPGHVRLHGVLRNSKEFSKAWKCPVGSNMNPAEKCRVW